MLIQIDDLSFVDDLCAHYTRSGFHAESVGGGMVEVTRPGVPAEGQERRGVLLHLRIWQVLSPDVTTVVVN